jgi:pilus assembly protein CpaE
MKIAVVPPNASHLQQASAALAARSHRITTVHDGTTRLLAVAQEESPDLMLADSRCWSAGELADVEQLTSRHPGIAVVLLSAVQSPQFLLEAMRAGVREVLPSPAPAEALRALVDRLQAKRRPELPTTAARTLAFLSCKGGSGATFLATNLGYHLAETASVLLVDLNLQFGEALSFVHDARPAATIADLAQHCERLDASLLASSAVRITDRYSILAAPEDPAQSLEIQPEHVQRILEIAAGSYEYVLLDVGRSLNPVTVKALDRADRIHAVLQAELPAVRNAARVIAALRALGYPADRTELILNRFDRSGAIGLDDIRRAVGEVAIRTVPNSWRHVHASINQGSALAATSRSNAVARTLTELAQSLGAGVQPGRSFLERLWRRA